MKERMNGGGSSTPLCIGRAGAGFSLVEVLLALALLGIGFSLATSLLTRGQMVHAYSRDRLRQVELCTRVLAELRLASTPMSLSEKPAAAETEPLLSTRARVVAAALPPDLRLVEVEVIQHASPSVFRCRGVVPARCLRVASEAPTPPAGAPTQVPAARPAAGNGGG